MRKLLLLLFLLNGALASAQHTISGKITDGDTGEGMPEATVQLLKTDSSFVVGALSDMQGNYRLKSVADGRYIVKITSVGYKALTRAVTVRGKDVAMPKLTMKSDAIMLQGTTVTGQAAKVVLKEDTFVYNTSAYRLPEGSVAEDLVKKIPGAEVSDDGTITVNGKQIKKILVDGKEFMTGDTKTAMKNLPTSIIEKVQAYDKQSDLARVSGIDDGEEEAVLDFGIKKGMNKGFFGDADVSIGTHSRYSEKLMAAYYNDKFRIMGFGNANNVNDRGFGGGGGRGWFGGMNGLNQQKMAGVNMNYEKKDKLQWDLSARWNHSDGDTRTKRSTENFVSTTGSFSNSLSQNYSRSNSWDFRTRVEWQPDSMTNVMLRASGELSKTDGLTSSNSASFNSDPYDVTDDPLSDEAIAEMAADSMMVNTNRNTTISYSDSKSVNATLQLNRKLNRTGRNVTVRAGVNWGDGASESLSMRDVHLYQILNQMGLDSTYQTNRYNTAPTKKWGYTLRATYSEPIATKTYLQLSYQLKYSQNTSDRSTYDFSNLGEGYFNSITPQYRDWQSYISMLQNPIEDYLDDDLSRYSKYQNWTQDIQLMFRMNREKFRLNAGIMLQPQRSHYIQDYQGVHVDTTRTVFNWSPTLDFRYRFSKVSNLRVNYRGTTTQPSMTQLLDITDDSDPLNISRGNPGLKPSFTSNFRLFYNNYVQSHQRSVMTFLNFQTTRNSISNKVTYNELTGGRTTRPENINGNWSANGAFMFNTSIDSAGVWNVNTFTNLGYNHYVAYLSLDRQSDSEKNVTKNMTVGERLSASYRNSWLELELNGSVNYQHSRNQLQKSSNLDTWQYAYGGSVNITLPWNMTLNTDLSNQSRRGYNDAAMNTNELIWNAQISQSFLRGNKLSVMVQFYDILHQQSNISRSISAMMRSDSEYNNINSYAMLHVTYRFSLFGGKAARQQMGPGGRDGGPGGPPPGGGRRGGGGGPGGPPPRF